MVRYGIVGDIEKNPEGLVHAVNTLRDKYLDSIGQKKKISTELKRIRKK